MTEYAADLSKRAMTANEFKLAEEYVRAARGAGCDVALATVNKVFVPGVRELVTRYLQGC